MATYYSKWVSSDDWRAVMDVSVSYPNATTASVKVTVKVQSQFGWTSNATRAVIKCGSQSHTVTGPDFSAGQTVTVGSHTFSVSRGSSKQTVSVSAKVNVPATTVGPYVTGTTVSGSASVNAIAYSAPNAPSSCAASRVSDRQAKVTWANGSTSTTRPRSSTKVERQTDGGSWVQVASVGSSVKSYTDNSISANHRYRYRVRAYGSGGYSGYSTSGYIYTTPAAPRSVSASIVQATTVRIAVDGSSAPYATGWEVQLSLNGGAWSDVGTFSNFPVTRDVGGGTVRLRARAVRGSLVSAWVESDTITTICPPLAPTVSLDPSGVVPTGAVVAVSWVPSHPDGSDQTQAQVEVTVGDDSPTTSDVTGAATSYQLPAEATAAPATVSVRVRTHGADEEWGAWSEPVAVTVAEPPSVAITSPASDGAVVADLPLVVTWEVEDSTGVAAQLLEVFGDDGTTLHTARLDGAARSYTLDASTYLLSNLSDYVLRLVVTGGSTIQATAERDFATEWTPPAEPTVDHEVDDEDLSVELTVHAGADAEGVPPTASLTVQRVNADSSLWVVGDGLADGETVVDPLPPLNTPVDYVVTAHTAAGATSELRITETLQALVGAFNFGQAAGECELARLDPDWSHDVARSGTLYHFADGGEGGGLPVAYGGQDVDATRSMGFALLDLDQLRRLQELAREHFVCWYRDPYGGRSLCSVSWSFSSGVPYDWLKVSASMTETVFEEAW